MITIPVFQIQVELQNPFAVFGVRGAHWVTELLLDYWISRLWNVHSRTYLLIDWYQKVYLRVHLSSSNDVTSSLVSSYLLTRDSSLTLIFCTLGVLKKASPLRTWRAALRCSTSLWTLRARCFYRSAVFLLSYSERIRVAPLWLITPLKASSFDRRTF